MTPDERQLLAGLFERTRSAAGNYRDPEAESFIADRTREQPYAPYLLAQTVLVQEHALQAANQQLEQLTARIHELEQRPAAAPSGGSFLGGASGSVFSGAAATQPQGSVPTSGASPWGRTDTAPAPAASGWPQQQTSQSPWAQTQPQQQGWSQPANSWGQSGIGGALQNQQSGGFLRGALGAAAGIAGGMLLANSIRGLFDGPHHNSLGIGSDLSGFNDPAGAAGPGFADTILDPRSSDQASNASFGFGPSPDADTSDTSDAGWSSGNDDTTDV